VSLSKEPAYSSLKSHFVCGYRNIMGEPYAGNSGTHSTRGNAIDTTNGAGGHNIQLFVMTPDGVVLHALAGYWNPQDLAAELQLALKINDLYNNKSLVPNERVARFKALEIEHIRSHSPETVARSELQGFDMQHEFNRRGGSDFVKDRSYVQGGHWGPDAHLAFRTTDEVMHKRMAERPFLTYGAFDVAKFCDYGASTYDKHEDNFDSNGQMAESPAPFQPIKGRKVMAGTAAVRSQARNKSCRTYVKTYGTLRKVCEPSSGNTAAHNI
jgi:hypothetical protein